MSRRAFTLIELLVVVAVIAILAAIAVPNFLEAQTRSKVSRAKADMSTLRTALESYAVDEGTYPLNAGGIGLTGALQSLTKPRTYLTSIPIDPFMKGGTYAYYAAGKVPTLMEKDFGSYMVASVGPDLTSQTGFSGTEVYDPTNGSVSRGDIVITQRSADQIAVASINAQTTSPP